MRRRSSVGWSSAVLLVVAIVGALGGVEARGAPSSTARLEAGRLLVARPGMLDGNFSETVVLLLHHGDDGALGVIVNRPTRMTLAQVLPDLELPAGRDGAVFSGGPMAVHRLLFVLRTATPPEGCHPVLADLCAGGSLDLLQEAFGEEPYATDLRGFAGHAGWAPGQLEWEIERRGWYVLPGSGERVFDEAPEALWSRLVRLAESPLA